MPYASGIEAIADRGTSTDTLTLPEVPHSLSMDAGVDTHDFRPWHYDEIADIMRKKVEAPALASDHQKSRHVRPVTGKNLGSRCYYF
jgi:hypothetical protein